MWCTSTALGMLLRFLRNNLIFRLNAHSALGLWLCTSRIDLFLAEVLTIFSFFIRNLEEHYMLNLLGIKKNLHWERGLNKLTQLSENGIYLSARFFF